MYTWSLKELYSDFDNTFEKDLNGASDRVDALASLAQTLDGKDSLEAWLTLQSSINTDFLNLYCFTELRLSTNANDEVANKYYGQLLGIMSRMSGPSALFTKWIYNHRDDFQNWLNESALVKEHEFILNETISKAQYSLSEDVEDAISKMEINGSSAWSQLQTQLTASQTISFKGEDHTLSSLRNFAYSSDVCLRKEAYFKELELYTQMDESVAFALNSIKGEVNQVNQLRGYKTPLEETLVNSRISQETLDALIQAIENKLPVFRRYLKHKATLMGHDNGLPWYDMFAPYVVDDAKEYSVEDSREMILDCFGSFSEDLHDMARRAYDEEWIDFLPREGKRGGAFCMNLPQIKQSRILSNYGYTISDIVTLAHELGHAYHGMMLEDNAILNTDYTMPVAETASTFCENIVFNAALATANDDVQVMLIENTLQDLTQITVDILSRYKFETEVFNRRNDEFLNSKALKEIMVQAQKDTYGDGIDETTYHPYMWICKGHYYSAGNNFYNFPYAFGGLFALGLYAQYQDQKDAFVPKYRELLKKTASASCEDVAKLAGVDTTDVAFWESSISIIEERINQYIELTSAE